MPLTALGWTPFFQAQIDQTDLKQFPARVIQVHRGLYRLSTGALEHDAELRGKLRAHASVAAGDFVLASLPSMNGRGRAVIERILDRRTKLSRKVAGRVTEEQVLAANLDAAWIVMALDDDFSLRRLERYLILVREGGVRPLIVLNKADLDGALVQERTEEVSQVAGDAPVFAISAQSGLGVERLALELAPRDTIALVGSSGVGKSTLANVLAGTDLQATAPIRESDGKGRHTTTSRELIVLPNEALLIDTPGLRELQLWDGSEGLSSTFGELAALAKDCRFSDCTHEHEPGCAVQAALERGDLEIDRFESHRAMQKELAHLERKQDAFARAKEKRRWKIIHRAQRNNPKRRR